MPSTCSPRDPRTHTRCLFVALALAGAWPGAAAADTSQPVTLTSYGVVQVIYSARAVVDDGSGGDGAPIQPAGVTISGPIGTFTIAVGGKRTAGGTMPRAWATTSGWINVSGANTPALGAAPRTFTFQISLPPGSYTLSSQSGAYSTSVRLPPASPGDPPDYVDRNDSYYVESFSAEVPDSAGSTATNAPTPESAAGSYTVSWSGSSGGVAVNSGSTMTMAVPYPGGPVSFTAFAQSTDGGIVRRLRIYRVSDNQVLADTSGSSGSLSATASYYASSADSLRAIADVDGFVMAASDNGSFVVPPGAAPMGYMVRFRLRTDTDGVNDSMRAARLAVTNSGGNTVVSKSMTAGYLDPLVTGVIANPNLSGGFELVFAVTDLLMPTQYATLPGLPPGIYGVSLGFGHAQSQQLNGLGDPQGLIQTMDWGPGDMAILGGVNPPPILASLTIDPPIATPTPTPTVTPPPNADDQPPGIRWTSPVVDNGTPQPLLQTVSCGNTITITATAQDNESLRSVTIRQVSDPMGLTNTTPIVTTVSFSSGSRVGTATVPLFVQYIPHPSFGNRTYEFTAQAQDETGNLSPLIRMVITGQDTVIPFTDINAVIVSGAPTPDQAFVGDFRLTGSIIALGDPGTVMDQPGNFPSYFRPDPRYLSGQWIPPAITWLHDMRIERFSLIARPSDADSGGQGRPMGRSATNSIVAPRPTPVPER